MSLEILKSLNKDNLHHAYLIEGSHEEITKEVFELIKSLGVSVVGNADVSHIIVDSFKVEDARNLKSYAGEKSFTLSKKFFVITANSFLLEAQNSLLKIFEEPIENTHFFIVVPSINSLLKTFVSRFYVISDKKDSSLELKNAEKFIKMNFPSRIDFIKELIVENEDEDEEGNEIVNVDSSRAKALRFLNAVEVVLHEQVVSKGIFDTFHQIFKVREFLRQPGSSTKILLESVALVVPNF